MPMDPRKQECFGHFLYGAGWFSRDENTLGMRGEHFCQRCPRYVACEREHDRRVRATAPAAVEAYDRLIAEGRRRGLSALLVKLLLGQRGKDPFAAAAVENFNRGHAERGQEAGFLVHSDVDPHH